MGCVPSKISRRVQQESFKRKENYGLEDLLAVRNGCGGGGGDQFLALLCTANTVARKLKANSLPHEPDPSISSSVSEDELKNNTSTVAIAVESESIDDRNQPPEPPPPTNIIETINTWELLDGLEDDTKEKEQEEEEVQKIEHSDEGVTENLVLQSSDMRGGVSKRKAMARELAALKTPAAGFEFSRSGSLRDWMLIGGQVFSPGSYVTPKFGSSVFPAGSENNGDNVVFDPELVKQFEEAMKELTMEEEKILSQIAERLEEGDDGEGDLEMEEEREKYQTMIE